jgi:hypothetical protein
MSVNKFVRKILLEPVPHVLMEQSGYSYTNFPVEETIELSEITDIDEAVTRMASTYVRRTNTHDFSYRLLQPRGEHITAKAKRIGMIAQQQFLLTLRAKKIKANLREIRYVHDAEHYGWLLFDPAMADRLRVDLAT